METATNLYYVIAASFIVYFIISYAYKILKIRNIEQALLTGRGLLLINLKHLIGIVLFGVLFILVASKYQFLILIFENLQLTILLLVIFLMSLTSVLAYFSVKKRLKNITEKSRYKFQHVWKYFGIRVLFLFSYEFFFRGVIFFSCLEVYNLTVALLITTALYVLIHSFDSRNEILGAIPFGIILCLLSFYSNSVWPAFLIHMSLSGVYEFIMFKQLTLKTLKS